MIRPFRLPHLRRCRHRAPLHWVGAKAAWPGRRRCRYWGPAAPPSTGSGRQRAMCCGGRPGANAPRYGRRELSALRAVGGQIERPRIGHQPSASPTMSLTGRRPWRSRQLRKAPLPIAGPSGNSAAGPTGNDVAPDFPTFPARLFDNRNGAFQVLGATPGAERGDGARREVHVVDVAKAEPSLVLKEPDLTVTALGIAQANQPSDARLAGDTSHRHRPRWRDAW